MLGRLIAFLIAAALGFALWSGTKRYAPRPLSFEPGVYHGAKLPTLTANQKRELTDRGNLLR